MYFLLLFFFSWLCFSWGTKQYRASLLPFSFFFNLEYSVLNWGKRAMIFFLEILVVWKLNQNVLFWHDLILIILTVCWVFNILFTSETFVLGLQFAAIIYMQTSQSCYIAGKPIDTHHLLPGTSPDWVLPVIFNGNIFYYSWKSQTSIVHH